MDDYLSKPVQLVNLAAMLEKWLPTVAALTPAPEATAPGETTLPTPPTTDISDISLTVDVDVLRSLIGDDEALIGEFLHDFRVSAAKIGGQLRTASAAGQATVAGSLAHKLKSSARSVGALALGELCAEIEQAGKATDADAVALLLPIFEQELTNVEAFLEEY
jgi:HPt (histidine-containing phosphotransfer) domain-containing protein